MNILLFPNTRKKQTTGVTLGIREFLTSRGVQCYAVDKEHKGLGALPLSEVDPKKIDFVLSMGGDGTILQFIHSYPEVEAPIIGINMGSLGFLADIPVTDLYPSLQDLIDGAYRLEDRVMMQGRTHKGETCSAVNEMVVHRAQVPSLIELAIHMDGVYLNTFSADGIIVATPSGSTAYSLAAGGPILTPELEAFVLTPISPHTISNRPIVLSPNREIQIQYTSSYETVEISYDGITSYSMHPGDVFHIRRHQRNFQLVKLLRHDYFGTLRSKLGWTGKLKQ